MSETVEAGVPADVYEAVEAIMARVDAGADLSTEQCVAEGILAERAKAIFAAAAYLDGMADNAKDHGAVSAESYHKAYEQGIREAADCLRAMSGVSNG
jgi:hypothetical protein